MTFDAAGHSERLHQRAKHFLRFIGEMSQLTDKSALEAEEKRDLMYQLSYCAIVARNIEKVARRPMTITLFGQSQAGKSYLVSGIVGNNNQDVQVIGGNGRKYDFLKEISPPGGDESTAQVTRFTGWEQTSVDLEFPIHIRLLSAAELAKILANGFAFECHHPDPPSREDFNQPSSMMHSGKEESWGLSEIELFDVERYVKEQLGDCLYFRQLERAGFWARIHENDGIGGQLECQAAYLSHLWGKSAALTELFKKLCKVLKTIPSEDLWVADECLLPVAESIIYVRPLKTNLRLGQDATVKAKDADGGGWNIPRSVLSALTAELVLQVPNNGCHRLLDRADILDFPGARARGGDFGIEELDVTPPAGQADVLSEVFLRGKVGYLFERYTELRDINSLVLCSPSEQPEAKSLPPLVQQWIHQTHGRTPEERDEKPVTLYVALTKFDRSLEVTAGLPAHSSARWETRLETHFKHFFSLSGDSWTSNWDLSGPFRNCFWVRNPNADQVFFTKLPSGEWIVDPNRVEQLDELAEHYLRSPSVRRHFPNPQESWDAVAKPDRTGVELLLNRITRDLKPERKRGILHSELNRLRKRLDDCLIRYADTPAVDRAREEANLCQDELRRNFRSFGWMLDRLSLRGQSVEEALKNAVQDVSMDAAPRKSPGGKSRASLAGVTVTDEIFGGPANTTPLPADSDSSETPEVTNHSAVAFADEVIGCWEAQMASAWSDLGLSASGFDKRWFDKLREELLKGARTTQGVAERIAQLTDPVFARFNPLGVAKCHAIIVTCIINNYLTSLGGTQIYLPEPGDDPPKINAEPFAGRDYMEEWLGRLEDLFVGNAGGDSAPGAFIEFAEQVKSAWKTYRPLLDEGNDHL